MKHFLLALLFSVSGLTLSAQITDAFSDGDFTNAPTWSGDNSDYIVNGSFELQLNGVIADTSYLSFASPFISNAEWQFWVKLTFAPSDNNNARIYLVSDVANLQGAVNGYYVRLGENGSFDSVDLWEQSGTTSTRIIDGINGHCAASTNTLRIRVTRSAAGLWNVYSDTLGGTNFLPEGSVTDNTHTTCNYFGVYSKYTVSNINKFFYDDVYAGPLIVDVTAPALVSASPVSSTQLDVLFNEPVDLATAQTLTNYSVNNSIGNPSAAVRDGSNFSLVHLTFATPFTSGLPNTLTVTNVQDLSANAITTANANFTWFNLSTAVFHDVVINEIMADPSPVVGLPNTEFIELHNRSAGNFDLTGWTFTDGSTTSTLGQLVLGAGQYLILCANADTQLFSSFGPVLGLSTFPSLNNTGDNLIIRDNANTLIDSVSFDISWYQDPNKDDGGWTLELINPNIGAGCATAGNWIASNNVAGGTPGTQNSVYNNSPDVTGPVFASVYATDSLHVTLCFNEGINPAQITVLSNYSISNGIGAPVTISYDTTTLQCIYLTLAAPLQDQNAYTVTFPNLGDCAGNPANPNGAIFSYYVVKQFDVVVNEIMADPDPPVALPNEEYLELHNTTPYSIQLENWQLTIGGTTRAVPNFLLQPDSFLVLTNTTAAPLFSGMNVLGVPSFQSLTNTGSAITLRTAQGLLIHNLTYDDSWYQNALKADGGWSLEMVDPNNPCAGMNNWRASVNATGGTPGQENSVLAANPDNVAPQLLRVSVITPDSIRAWFSESIDSTSLANLVAYSIDNSMGQPVAAIPEGPDFNTVKLRLPSTMLAGIIYTLTANNTLSDCAGNAMNSNSTARFALPLNVSPNDVVINEILPDPNDGGVDYVEIYNRSNKVIDLQKMYLCTMDTLTGIFEELNVIAPEGFLFFPQDYLLLSEDGAIVKSQYQTTNPNAFLDMSNIPSMNIDGDIVVLIDTSGLIIDKLVYSSDWHYPLLQQTKGVSLERIDFDRTTQDATNWHSASENAGYGTPGYKNSQFSPGGGDDGAVTVSQEVFSPDNDGVNDIVNINYHFDAPGFTANVQIYDARGRLVRNLVKSELLGTEEGTFSWDGIDDAREKSRIGIYVIYFEAFNTHGEVKKYKQQCVLAGKL
ncbi:MAG: hypothetical protein FD123_62 [Bacteroidetes bacterium]|nr:MAG: hypothetical protein FD123_62 [Bacteroidota bacterium]